MPPQQKKILPPPPIVLIALLSLSLSQIEQEVRALREETAQDESRYHYLNNMLAIMEVQLQRVREEMKNYKAGDASGKRPKSYRDVYQKKIQEQENLGKTLKEKQKVCLNVLVPTRFS